MSESDDIQINDLTERVLALRAENARLREEIHACIYMTDRYSPPKNASLMAFSAAYELVAADNIHLREALEEIRQYAINCQNSPYVTATKDPVACPYWIQERVDAALEVKP